MTKNKKPFWELNLNPITMLKTPDNKNQTNTDRNWNQKNKNK